MIVVWVARTGPGKSEDGIDERSQKSYDCKDTWLLPSYCDRLIVAADRPQNLLDKILPRSLGCTVKKNWQILPARSPIDSPDFTHAALVHLWRHNYLSIKLR